MPLNQSNVIPDDRPPIPVSHELVEFEVKANLPLLLGTSRQVDWARNIRRQFLVEVFATVMEKTATLAPDEAKAVFNCLDNIRANKNAKHWIEAYRPHLGDAITFLVELPAAIAAERQRREEAKIEQERRQQKAKENRKQTIEAGKWESSMNLPEIEGKSVAQTNFARRCRYLLLKDRGGPYLLETDAGFWIAQLLKTEQEITPERE